MNNTRENVIALLEKMADNAYALSEIYRDEGDDIRVKEYLAKYTAYDNAVRLLENKKYFNTIWKIHNKEANQ